MQTRFIAIAFVLICSLLSSGCTFLYRPTIQQGNIICDDVVAQLHPGMSANEVLYLMGTPLITNTFQPDRWDYVYTLRRGGAARVQRHITLFFSADGVLQHVQPTPLVMIR